MTAVRHSSVVVVHMSDKLVKILKSGGTAFFQAFVNLNKVTITLFNPSGEKFCILQQSNFIKTARQNHKTHFIFFRSLPLIKTPTSTALTFAQTVIKH